MSNGSPEYKRASNRENGRESPVSWRMADVWATASSVDADKAVGQHLLPPFIEFVGNLVTALSSSFYTFLN